MKREIRASAVTTPHERERRAQRLRQARDEGYRAGIEAAARAMEKLGQAAHFGAWPDEKVALLKAPTVIRALLPPSKEMP